jgi:phospholipid N-methyltransferase
LIQGRQANVDDGERLRPRVLRQFLAAPRQTGAVAPSSEALAQALADLAFRGAPRLVVEIGAGSGAVTRELRRRAAETGSRVVAVEVGERLAGKHRGYGVRAHAAWLPVRSADVIVSGIPFASLRAPDADAILAEAARVAPRLVLFQYTRRRLPMIQVHFPEAGAMVRVPWNFPPAIAMETRVATAASR